MRFRIVSGIMGLLLLSIINVRSAEVLAVPDQSETSRVETFLELDKVPPFSHETLFAVVTASNPLLPVRLTLKDAISLAQQNLLQGSLSREKINEEIARRWQVSSLLLPQLEGGIFQSRTYKQNLEAQGLRGYGTIGPFNTFDARLRLTQKIIDIGAFSQSLSAAAQVKVARFENALIQQKIILISVFAYLDALRAQGAYHAAEAGVFLSERLLRQAEARRKAGVEAGIDVARARTRLAEDQVDFQKTLTGLHDAYLELQRSTGLGYDRVINLVNSLGYVRDNVLPINEALALSARKRIDMRLSHERVYVAKSLLTQAKAQRFPIILFSANYGLSGNEWDNSAPRTSGAMLSAAMPLFEGGRISGEIKGALSRERQAELVRDDLSRQVEEDVRKALWTLTDASNQVEAAARLVDLSRQEMDLAAHRFSEGVADHIEVVSAQTSLAQARDGYVVALTLYHTARINYYFALGEPELFFLQDTAESKE